KCGLTDWFPYLSTPLMTDLEKLDLRTRSRYLRKGILAQKDVDQHLDSLRDVVENAEWIDYDRRFQEQERAELEATLPEARPPEKPDPNPSTPGPSPPPAQTLGAPASSPSSLPTPAWSATPAPPSPPSHSNQGFSFRPAPPAAPAPASPSPSASA